MPIYLLDTNIISDIIRSPDGVAAGRFKSKVPEPGAVLATSVVVR